MNSHDYPNRLQCKVDLDEHGTQYLNDSQHPCILLNAEDTVFDENLVWLDGLP
jgi:hypothetical protein